MADFQTTAGALMMAQPFFASLFLRYKHRETRSIPTLAVGLREFLYNPDFLASLDDDTALAGFAHEVMHGVYQHVAMQRDYFQTKIGPDGKTFDPERWAKAIDYCVNRAVVDAGVGRISSDWYFDPKYTADWTPQAIYDDLALQDKGKTRGQKALDEHGVPDDDEVDDTPEKHAITVEAIVSGARTAKAMGKLPASIERMLGEFTTPDRNPWAVLQQFASAVAGTRASTTYRSLQRKLVTRGIGAPGKRREGVGTFGIVGDCSGSIDDATVQLFAGHLELILRQYRPEEIILVWCDHEVRRVIRLKTAADLRREFRNPVPAGGGTDMRVGVSSLEGLGCDAIVVLTDGYTPYPTSCTKPLLWAMTTEKTAPIGRTIRL